MITAQDVDGENTAICVLFMFTPRIMVINMCIIVSFLYFLLTIVKNNLQVWQKYLVASERSHRAGLVWIRGFSTTIIKISTPGITGF